MQVAAIAEGATLPEAHIEQAFWPVRENVPAAQLVHRVAAEFAANEPATQRWQVSAFDVVEKVPAEQSAHTVLALGEHAVAWYVPGAQLRQA